MRPEVKYGLILGIASFFITFIMASIAGVCGPFGSIAAGAVAGYLAAKEAQPNKTRSTKIGGSAGGLAGVFGTVGQLIATIVTLSLLPSMLDDSTPLGAIVTESAAATPALFWISGMGTGLCFGIVGVLFAAGAGAGIAYMTSDNTSGPTQPGDGPDNQKRQQIYRVEW